MAIQTGLQRGRGALRVRPVLAVVAAILALPALAANAPRVGALLADAGGDALSAKIDFDLPAQPLGSALRQLADQAGLQIMFEEKIVDGLQVPALKGRHSAAEALQELLVDTDLEFTAQDKTVAVRTKAVGAQGSKPASQGTRSSPQSSTSLLARSDPNFSVVPVVSPANRTFGQTAEDGSTLLEEIVVTGTHIRGAQIAAPVLTITQEQMRLSGQTNLGDVIRSLPQNFGGGQNPTVVQGAQTGVGNNNNQNASGGSGLNLRGLGADATLTLLNGVRLPYDGSGQAVDISVIPVAALDRVEILLDGASAIYGSDAVGGVANVILKRDYSGAEMSVRYGGATEGGFDQEQYQGIGGTTWSTGGFLLTGDFSHNSAILSGQRDYLANAATPLATAYPRATQRSGLFSGHQSLGELVEVTLDSFYTDRDQNLLVASPTSDFPQTIKATSWGVSPALHFSLPADWSARLGGFTGQDETRFYQPTISAASGAQIGLSAHCSCNKASSADLQLEGAMFSLPGGAARLSVGGGFRRNDYIAQILAGAGATTEASDHSHYFYAESNLPLVSPDQQIPLVAGLSLNAAVRNEDYKSFGSTTTPKFGINWAAVQGFEVKGSWGQSYKVPELSQMFGTRAAILYPNTFVAGVPAGGTVIVSSGSNPNLTPERANTVSAGFAVRPVWIPDFNLEASWFHIDYKDRVLQPINPLTTALTNPADIDFVTTRPTVAQQNALFAATGVPPGTFLANLAGGAYDPAKVAVLVNNLNANASAQHTHGIDLTARYGLDAFGGRISLTGDVNWLESERKVTPQAAYLPVSGLVFYPAETRAQMSASWRRGGLTLNSIAHYISGVTDTDVTPHVARASMTTFDLVLDYRIRLPVAGDLGLNLAALNVADRKPPYMRPVPAYFATYDSTNYSAVGRLLSVMVTKKF